MSWFASAGYRSVHMRPHQPELLYQRPAAEPPRAALTNSRTPPMCETTPNWLICIPDHIAIRQWQTTPIRQARI